MPFGVERDHTIALDGNGMVQGRVAALKSNPNDGLSNMQVFFVQDGEIVKQVMTTSNGSFIVSGLEPGAYTFVASGGDGFAAYGLQIVPAGQPGGSMIEVSALTPMNDVLKGIIDRELDASIASSITQVEDTQGAPIKGSNLVTLVNGSLVGNLHGLYGQSAGEGVTVYLVDGDQEVAKAVTDENGSFTVPDLKPGVYGFVAAGKGMFGAVSMEVAGSVAEIPVSLQEGDGASLQLGASGDVGAAQQDDSNPEFMPIEEFDEFGPMTFDGGFAPTAGQTTYAGGGPGFIGGSRLGRLALLGGAVAGIVALASDGESGSASEINP